MKKIFPLYIKRCIKEKTFFTAFYNRKSLVKQYRHHFLSNKPDFMCSKSHICIISRVLRLPFASKKNFLNASQVALKSFFFHLFKAQHKSEVKVSRAIFRSDLLPHLT